MISPVSLTAQIKKKIRKTETPNDVRINNKKTKSFEKKKVDQVILKSNDFCLESIEALFETKLFVCKSGNSCQENLGFVKESLHLPSKDLEKKYKFTWSTKRENVDGILWQISRTPFDCNSIEQSGLIKSGRDFQKYVSYGVTKGSFEIDFRNLTHFTNRFINLSSSPGIKATGIKPKIQKKKMIRPGHVEVKIYYVRIIPIVDSNPVFGCSNSLSMRFDDLPPDSELNLYIPPPLIFPDVFRISNVEFTPFIFPNVKWGSMEIIGFDEALYQQALKQSLNPSAIRAQRQNYENAMKTNRAIQPASYKGKGSEGWLESLWNAAKSATDWVSESYENAKAKLVDIVADIIDNLPLIECEGDCKSILQASLETGLVAVGIPPRLPNAEQLIDEGVDYLASEAAYQMGCGELCAEEIEKQLKELGDQITAHHRQITENEAEAHKHGCEPLILPKWVKARISPRSMIQMPKLVVEIERTYENVPESDQIDLEAYHLQISSICSNKDYVAGKSTGVAVNTNYRDGYRVNDQTKKLHFKKDAIASLFRTQTFHIPPLEKGERIRIPVTMQQSLYLFPGHLDMIREVGGHIWYDDWTSMYNGGDIKFITSIVSEELEPISWTTKTKVIRRREDVIQNVSDFLGSFKPPQRIQ